MTTIKLKNGSGAPTAGDLVQGEPALDLTNKRLYTEDSGGTVIEVGTNPGEDVTFADNRKAVFGAGSDLNIYHDGSNSYINDTGTGNLFVRASDNFYVQNSAGTETKAAFTTDGAVKLYYNGGTKFQTVSGGVDVTGVITTDGMTTSADINFGDNDKAVFGAGNDLSVYHDGSNSYIKEEGTGNLEIGTNGGNITLKNLANSETLALFNINSGVNLYYDNAVKLETTSTGIDVTGTVTADGLTVENSSGATLNVNTNSGAADSKILLHEGTTASPANGASIRYDGANNIFKIGVGSSVDTTRLTIDRNTGDISFYEDTGTTAKLFWDASAESLGIGTSSPATMLELAAADNDGTNAPRLRITNSSTTLADGARVGTLEFHNSDTTGSGPTTASIEAITNSTDERKVELTFNPGFNGATTEAMRIDSSGNVGINTDSPAYKLQANGSGTIARFTDGTSHMDFYAGSGLNEIATASPLLLSVGGTERMRIDASGNVGIGTSPSQKLHVVGTSRPALIGSDNAVNIVKLYNSATGSASYNGLDFIVNSTSNAQISAYGMPLTFGTSASNGTDATERMRIDSSGNLLVGTTDLTLYDETNGGETGFALRPDGRLYNSTQGNTSAIFNRIGTGGTESGAILQFRSNGSTVGSIASNNGNRLAIGSSDTGLLFVQDADDIIPFSMSGGSGRDAAIDLGQSGNRFKDLYLSGGAYLGGTGSANKLDDYEEGTWTPALGGTWTTNPTNLSGRYIKVGNFVWIEAKMTGGVKASSTSGYLTGLPFSTNNSFGGTGAVVDSAVTDHGSCLFQNTDRIWLTDTDFGTGTVYVTGGYEVA